MNTSFIRSAMWVLIIFSVLMFARTLLLQIGFPDGSLLEALAQRIQGREASVEEAVAAFCRTLVEHGTD